MRAKTAWRWEERPVDKAQDHFEILYGDVNTQEVEKWVLVALVSTPVGTTFSVMFFIEPNDAESSKMVDAVRKELDFYLVEKGEPNPWNYAKYHSSSASNVYSNVHWAYHRDTGTG